MKSLVAFVCVFFCLHNAFGQETSPEAEIRKLEEQERQAVLRKDTAVLRKIWDKYFIVNAPGNRIVIATDNPADRPVISQMNYESFTREIEQILVRGDVVFSMGNEIVVPAGNAPNAGKEVKRRFTNVWIKQGNVWTLAARHANIVCE